jgi:hypothetical protein
MISYLIRLNYTGSVRCDNTTINMAGVVIGKDNIQLTFSILELKKSFNFASDTLAASNSDRISDCWDFNMEEVSLVTASKKSIRNM